MIEIKLKNEYPTYLYPRERRGFAGRYKPPYNAKIAYLARYSPFSQQYEVLFAVSPEEARQDAKDGYQVRQGMPVWWIGSTVIEDMSDYVFNDNDWILDKSKLYVAKKGLGSPSSRDLRLTEDMLDALEVASNLKDGAQSVANIFEETGRFAEAEAWERTQGNEKEMLRLVDQIAQRNELISRDLREAVNDLREAEQQMLLGKKIVALKNSIKVLSLKTIAKATFFS